MRLVNVVGRARPGQVIQSATHPYGSGLGRPTSHGRMGRRTSPWTDTSPTGPHRAPTGAALGPGRFEPRWRGDCAVALPPQDSNPLRTVSLLPCPDGGPGWPSARRGPVSVGIDVIEARAVYTRQLSMWVTSRKSAMTGLAMDSR